MRSYDEPELQQLAEDLLARRISRRNFIRGAAAIGVSATAAAVFLSACGATTNPHSARPPAAKQGGTLVYGPFGDGENYDPATNDDDYPAPPFPTIYEGLTAYVPGTSWESKNLLAETLEKSPDGKKYAFTLKQGVQFHHGFGELTAADVKYSFERAASVQELYPGAPKSAVSYYAGDFRT